MIGERAIQLSLWLMFISIFAACLMYLVNDEIVKRPRLDFILAVSTWIVVISSSLFIFAISSDYFWLLAIAIFAFSSLFPYADFMRGLAWIMLVVGIYLLAINTTYIIPGVLMAFISAIEIGGKFEELAQIERSKIDDGC
jgi:hypothetical protein